MCWSACKLHFPVCSWLVHILYFTVDIYWNEPLISLPISLLQRSLCTSLDKWQPTPVLLPGKPLGRRSVVGAWGCKVSDMTEQLHCVCLNASQITDRQEENSFTTEFRRQSRVNPKKLVIKWPICWISKFIFNLATIFTTIFLNIITAHFWRHSWINQASILYLWGHPSSL